MLIQWFGRFGVVDFLAEITHTLEVVYGDGWVIRASNGHYLFVASKQPDPRMGDRLANLRLRYRATGGLGLEFWPIEVVLNRLAVESPRLVTEDWIPFGRLFVGVDRQPALDREAVLRGEG